MDDLKSACHQSTYANDAFCFYDFREGPYKLNGIEYRVYRSFVKERNKNCHIEKVGWVYNILPDCMACRKPFNMYYWKHHCRACGNLICSRCSDHKAMLANVGELGLVRVCGYCHNRRNKTYNTVTLIDTSKWGFSLVHGAIEMELGGIEIPETVEDGEIDVVTAPPVPDVSSMAPLISVNAERDEQKPLVSDEPVSSVEPPQSVVQVSLLDLNRNSVVQIPEDYPYSSLPNLDDGGLAAHALLTEPMEEEEKDFSVSDDNDEVGSMPMSPVPAQRSADIAIKNDIESTPVIIASSGESFHTDVSRTPGSNESASSMVDHASTSSIVGIVKKPKKKILENRFFIRNDSRHALTIVSSGDYNAVKVTGVNASATPASGSVGVNLGDKKIPFSVNIVPPFTEIGIVPPVPTLISWNFAYVTVFLHDTERKVYRVISQENYVSVWGTFKITEEMITYSTSEISAERFLAKYM